MQLVLWTGFTLFVLVMLALDLGVFHKGSRIVGAHEALRWSGFCAFLALAFSGFIYMTYEHGWFDLQSELSGAEAAKQYVTGWLVEQSLSLDNIFVFAVVFSFFGIPLQYQYRVLFWGVIGALALRGIMIAIGAAMLAYFSWAEYLFGALLFYAGVKMLRMKDEVVDPEHNILLKLVKRFYPVSPQLDGEKFFTVLPNGKKAITPLFVVLLVLESTDLLFAVDSIPAVFAVTKEPFIVFSSNIFAILNLRSLYFALSSLIAKFEKLKISLALILLFVAFKMLTNHHYPISTGTSLMVIVGLLIAGVLASLISNRRARSKRTAPNRSIRLQAGLKLRH